MTGPKKIQLRTAKDGSAYFVAVGANNEDGPVSETYPDEKVAREMAETWWPGVPVERDVPMRLEDEDEGDEIPYVGER